MVVGKKLFSSVPKANVRSTKIELAVSRRWSFVALYPLLIRGEWRVGFYAIVDIKEGTELLYDYGQQPNPPRRIGLCRHFHI